MKFNRWHMHSPVQWRTVPVLTPAQMRAARALIGIDQK
jgi:hypothetical protein